MSSDFIELKNSISQNLKSSERYREAATGEAGFLIEKCNKFIRTLRKLNLSDLQKSDYISTSVSWEYVSRVRKISNNIFDTFTRTNTRP